MYLYANYPEQEAHRIIQRLLSGSDKRSVTICAECGKYVNEDLVLPPPQDEMRLCDFVVDPIYTTASTQGPDVAHERFEERSLPSSASGAGISHVIGLSVEQFAPAVAALSDHEEMVLALVHPLVQVYTIPRTGQLAYVGHICNFPQKVTKFLSRLPVMPADMPCVQVRPRKYKGHSPGKALFKVDVQKLRLAFEWLKQHNPFYYHVEWREDAATAWEA